MKAATQSLKLLAGVVLVSLALGVGLYFHSRPNPSLAESEQYAVYSAFLEPQANGESIVGSDRTGTIVILGRTTISDTMADQSKLRQSAFLAQPLLRATHKLPVLSAWPLIDLLVANLQHQELQRRFTLSAHYELATEGDRDLYLYAGSHSGRYRFENRFPGSSGYQTFTRVGFNRELTEAVFYTEHVCALCGGAGFVYMRKVNGKWVTLDRSFTWIS